MAVPLCLDPFLHGDECFLVCALEILKSGLALLTHWVEPVKKVVNGIARLGKVNHNDHCCLMNAASNNSRLEQVGESSPASKLIAIDLDLFVVLVLFLAAPEFHGGCFGKFVLDLLVQELCDQRRFAWLLLSDEHEWLALCLGFRGMGGLLIWKTCTYI